ncbi:MAG: RNA-binding protein [Thermoanaerobaculaceae bacterium]|jgi:RNA recognition motif-containing protein|nr:RNA-binding protein [Thermoanaerobaculaceae bacterium]
MSAKLYVGGLSFSTTSEALRAHFAPFGTVVSSAIVTERDSSQSRGFGFVEMSSQTEAEAAIAALNQQPLDGKALTVNVAKSKLDRAPRM